MKYYYEVQDTPDTADPPPGSDGEPVPHLFLRQSSGGDVIAFTGNLICMDEADAQEYVRGGMLKRIEEPPGAVALLPTPQQTAADIWQRQISALKETDAGAHLSQEQLAHIAALLAQPIVEAISLISMAESADEETPA